jgi:hypothetical protein
MRALEETKPSAGSSVPRVASQLLGNVEADVRQLVDHYYAQPRTHLPPSLGCVERETPCTPARQPSPAAPAELILALRRSQPSVQMLVHLRPAPVRSANYRPEPHTRRGHEPTAWPRRCGHSPARPHAPGGQPHLVHAACAYCRRRQHIPYHTRTSRPADYQTSAETLTCHDIIVSPPAHRRKDGFRVRQKPSLRTLRATSNDAQQVAFAGRSGNGRLLQLRRQAACSRPAPTNPPPPISHCRLASSGAYRCGQHAMTRERLAEEVRRAPSLVACWTAAPLLRLLAGSSPTSPRPRRPRRPSHRPRGNRRRTDRC